MTKHFDEESGSCVLGELIPLKELVKREKPEPPKPPLMRVGVNGYPCPLCGSGMKPKGCFGILFNVFKGCYQPDCENYWRDK